MNKSALAVALALALAAPLSRAADQPKYDFRDHWPTHLVLADGTDLGVAFKYQYDVDRFSRDNGRLADAQTNRRKELGAYVRKKGVYDAIAVFDFQSRNWLDVYARVQSKALFGRDVGALRAGYSKTPVGLEGNTGTGATTFLETALPTQAIYAGRRIGLDWALARKYWLLNAGYYWAGDLQGGSDGRMTALRAAWTPRNAPGDVLHLGISASREDPHGSTDGRDIYTPPGARLRAKPEAGLTTVRLVDSGTLSRVDHIDRTGLEALWIGGPWSLQGEYLDARVRLDDGRPTYRGRGWYAFGSGVLTGESRSYKAGTAGDVKPRGPYGAVELALRYSELNLDDAPVLGGAEHNWTLGANWYINRYLKLQGNYVRAHSDRRGVVVDPDIVEVRAQIAL